MGRVPKVVSHESGIVPKSVVWTTKLQKKLLTCYLRVRSDGEHSTGEGEVKDTAWPKVVSLFNKVTGLDCSKSQAKNQYGTLRKKLRAYEYLHGKSGAGEYPPFFPPDWDGWTDSIQAIDTCSFFRKYVGQWPIYELMMQCAGHRILHSHELDEMFTELQDMQQQEESPACIPDAETEHPVELDPAAATASPAVPSPSAVQQGAPGVPRKLAFASPHASAHKKQRVRAPADTMPDPDALEVKAWVSIDIQTRRATKKFLDWAGREFERGLLSRAQFASCFRLHGDHHAWLMSIPECRRMDFLPALVEPRTGEVDIPYASASGPCSVPATAQFIDD